MEENKKSFWLRVVLVIALIIVFAFIGFYIGKISNGCETCKKCEEVVKDPKAHNIGKNVINGQNVIYDIYANDNIMGIQVGSNSDQKSVTIDVYKDAINKYFNMNLGSNISAVTSFNQKLLNVFIGYFGQAAGQEYLLFLLEDGTIEYIPIYKELLNGGNFNSYGKIVGVNDVIGFVYLTVEKTNFDYYSVGAVRSDGTIYDLMDFLDTMV